MKNVPNIFYLHIGLCRKQKCHVIARTEDNEEIIITYRFFGRHKQYWHYAVNPEEDLLFILNLIEAKT